MSSLINQLHNDKSLLIKLLKRYRLESLGSKGFIHGLQKDLIQNCVGGRVSERFIDWTVVFELLKIDGKYALSVTDHGTTGLLGGVYSNEQVAEISESGGLDERYGLSRFVHQNFSGGNTGPGSEGQGKGLFHLLSKDYEVVFDSLRNEGLENESYVSGQKIMKGNVLKNNIEFPDDPLVPDRSKNEDLFKKLTNNELLPLSKQGTRVIIKNIGTNDVVKEVYEGAISNDKFDENGGLSFIDVFRNSFNEDLDDKNCVLSLKNMILETWWEILRNYSRNGAKIIIKEGDNVVEVNFNGSLVEKIVDAEDSEDVVVELKKNLTGSERLYFQEQLGGDKYYIKELKFVYFKNGRPGLEPGVFIQRKGMKIGEIIRKNEVRESLLGKFYGYVILDDSAQEMIHKAENEVHYGFNFNIGVSKKLRSTIKDVLKPFFDKFTRERREDNSSSMMDNYRAISSILSLLGSFSNLGGHKRSGLMLSWLDVGLPENNRGVSYVSDIGPVKILIKNEGKELFSGKAILSLYSTGVNGKKIEIDSQDVEVSPGGEITIGFSEFKIPTLFESGLVFLKASVGSNGLERVKKTFGLWLNSPVPENETDSLVSLVFNQPVLPNANSQRVDIGDSIKGLGFVFGSNIPKNISLKIEVDLEHRNEHGSWVSFHSLYEGSHDSKPYNEKLVELDDLVVSEEVFGFFQNKERTVEKRRVRIFVKVTSLNLIPELGINIGQKLASSSRVQFNVGIDAGGNSPFKRVVPFDGLEFEKSKYSGTASSGYVCEINQLFHEYKTIESIEDDVLKKEMKDDYESREIVRQAIMLCLANESFEGPLFNESSSEFGEGNGRKYKDLYTDNDFLIDPRCVCGVTEELINKLTSQC